MKTRIHFSIVIMFLLLFSGAAHAGMKLRVNQDFISIYPPNRARTVFITGMPRSVVGARPIKITVYNATAKTSQEGLVHKNGSFSVAVEGHAKDKLKVTFIAANGKKKTVKLKVPTSQ